MTATVLQFDKQLERAWRIVEVEPGRWRGELHERGHGMRRHTEIGEFYIVRDAVLERCDGLPIRIKRLPRDPSPYDDGPIAA